MFRVNNKDTRTTAMGSFWCLYCLLWTYFTTCSSIFMVNFEHVIAGWVGSFLLHEFFLIVICKLGTISPETSKKAYALWVLSKFYNITGLLLVWKLVLVLETSYLSFAKYFLTTCVTGGLYLGWNIDPVTYFALHCVTSKLFLCFQNVIVSLLIKKRYSKSHQTII